MTAPLSVMRYHLPGLRLRVESNSPPMTARLDGLIGAFRASADADEPHTSPSFHALLRCVESSADLPAAQNLPTWRGPAADGSLMRLSALADGRLYELPDRAALEMRSGGHTVVTFVRGCEQAASHGCLVPMLADMLAEAGMLMIHAAALTAPAGRRALVLLGPCGRGKTTTALAALGPTGASAALICDDACVLRDNGGTLDLWGLPRDVKLSQASCELLGWPVSLPHEPADEAGERRIALTYLPSTPVGAIFDPVATVFLAPRNTEHDRLKPIDPTTALTELLKLNLRCGDASQTARAAADFARLADLARRPAYRLSVGPEIASVAKTLATLLR